ncbi:hypothetical protein GCM10009616_29320 [Microlunatus lacustris]
MELLVARNPVPNSSLPFLLLVPLGDGLLFRTKGTWPRTSALYCRPAPGRTGRREPDVIEQIPLRSCVRRVRRSTSSPTAARRPAADGAVGRAGGPPRPDGRSRAVPVPVHAPEEWTYRYLATAFRWLADEAAATARVAVADAPDPPGTRSAAVPDNDVPMARIHRWAREAGLPVSDRVRLRPDVVEAWRRAQEAAGQVDPETR